MKLYEATAIIIIIVGIAAAIGFGSSYFLKDDNKVEEKCEEVIELATGRNIDLSKSTPEILKKPKK